MRFLDKIYLLFFIEITENDFGSCFFGQNRI